MKAEHSRRTNSGRGKREGQLIVRIIRSLQTWISTSSEAQVGWASLSITVIAKPRKA